MGKKIRMREARRREAEQCVSALLEIHSRAEARPRPPACFLDFKLEYRDRIEAVRDAALRAPEDWRCRIKSRSEERRFIDLVRFTFARYSVAEHLERCWLEEIEDDFVDRIGPPHPQVVRRVDAPNLRRWYIVAAQGGSLYKWASHHYLSKQETHHFLTTPDVITSTKRAFWYAVARPAAVRNAVAIKIANSKIANYSIASTFWKEVARFFARNPSAAAQMDDLVDFLLVARQEDRHFTLKGRTLASLLSKMEDWHRSLGRKHAIGDGSWVGSPVPDIDYTIGKDDKWAIWRFRQIKTGSELYREGHRMHHCVATYKPACMRGDISIWSVTSEFPIGRVNRGVTIEMTRDGRIVQCRGFANRLPYANEVTIAKRWAREHNLTWASLER